MTKDHILRVSNLYAGYGKNVILHDVSVLLSRDTLTLIVGPNGSGKSTLAKAIFNLASVFSGEIIFKNIDVTKMMAEEKTMLGMQMIPQTSNVFENLTVRENLEISFFNTKKAHKNKKTFRDMLEYVLQIFPNLKNREYEKVKLLSGGERQMVALARALITEPELIIFDEPTAMLSPALSNFILNKIREINQSGVAVMLIEQNVKAAINIADYLYVLLSGRKVLEGPSDKFTKDFKLLEDAFFGRVREA